MKIKRLTFARIKSLFGDQTEFDDMLRYDTAFQWQADPHVVVFPVFVTKHGDLGGKITTDRWRSFGFTVEPIDDQEEIDHLKFELRFEEWITRRALAPWNRTLLAFTLASFVAAKDLEHIIPRPLPS
jgi:hypothetical protein